MPENDQKASFTEVSFLNALTDSISTLGKYPELANVSIGLSHIESIGKAFKNQTLDRAQMKVERRRKPTLDVCQDGRSVCTLERSSKLPPSRSKDLSITCRKRKPDGSLITGHQKWHITT